MALVQAQALWIDDDSFAEADNAAEIRARFVQFVTTIAAGPANQAYNAALAELYQLSSDTDDRIARSALQVLQSAAERGEELAQAAVAQASAETQRLRRELQSYTAEQEQQAHERSQQTEKAIAELQQQLAHERALSEARLATERAKSEAKFAQARLHSDLSAQAASTSAARFTEESVAQALSATSAATRTLAERVSAIEGAHAASTTSLRAAIAEANARVDHNRAQSIKRAQGSETEKAQLQNRTTTLERLISDAAEAAAIADGKAETLRASIARQRAEDDKRFRNILSTQAARADPQEIPDIQGMISEEIQRAVADSNRIFLEELRRQGLEAKKRQDEISNTLAEHARQLEDIRRQRFPPPAALPTQTLSRAQLLEQLARPPGATSPPPRDPTATAQRTPQRATAFAPETLLPTAFPTSAFAAPPATHTVIPPNAAPQQTVSLSDLVELLRRKPRDDSDSDTDSDKSNNTATDPDDEKATALSIKKTSAAERAVPKEQQHMCTINCTRLTADEFAQRWRERFRKVSVQEWAKNEAERMITALCSTFRLLKSLAAARPDPVAFYAAAAAHTATLIDAARFELRAAGAPNFTADAVERIWRKAARKKRKRPIDYEEVLAAAGRTNHPKGWRRRGGGGTGPRPRACEHGPPRRRHNTTTGNHTGPSNPQARTMMEQLFPSNNHRDTNEHNLPQPRKTLMEQLFPTAKLSRQPTPPPRIRTRLQQKIFEHQNKNGNNNNNSSSSEQTSSSDNETSSSHEEHFGVTIRTAQRRTKLYKDFNKFTRKNSDTTANNLLNFLARKKWKPSTQLSNAQTILGTIRRTGGTTTGDVQGALRLLKKISLEHGPARATPMTPQTFVRVFQNTPTLETKTLLALAWACAARLSSITALRRDNVYLTQISPNMCSAKIIFRTGKTILTTGPYTIKTFIPTYLANWILQQPNQIFQKEIRQYYSLLKKPLAQENLCIRSVRRGALQHLSTSFSPEQILLLSRHTSVKGLYAYLDDGAQAHWEHKILSTMTATLWE